MPNLFLNLPALSSGAGTAIDVSGMGQRKTIIVGGSFDGNLTVEYATDVAGTNWAPIAGFQNPGRQEVQVACRWMRVNTSGFRGGAMNVDVGASDAGAVFAELSGVAVDISSMPPFKTVVVGSPGGSTVNIEVSVDGTSWSQVATFQHAGGASFYSTASRARAVSNGGALPAIWLAAGFDEYTPGSNQPAFPTIVTPGDWSQTVIYARTTGNDTTGDGSLTNPYRTYQRARRDIPKFIEMGFGYVVDCTGIGVETLPQDYAEPCTQGCPGAWIDPSPAVPYFQYFAPIVCRAIPQLVAAIPAADARVTAGVVADVGPGLCKVTIGVARASWDAGALKGKQVIKTLSGDLVACTIFDSTTTELFLCNSSANFNGGAGALVLGVGETLDIVEPSATLEAPPSTLRGPAIDCGGVEVGCVYQGIRTRATVAGQGFGQAVAKSINVHFELCDLVEPAFVSVGAGFPGSLIMATQVTGSLYASMSDLTVQRSYWNVDGSLYLTGEIDAFEATVFEGCVPVGLNYDKSFPLALDFLNCWFIAPTGDAISLKSSSTLSMDTCQIDDFPAAANGITLDGPVRASLDTVTGAGVAGSNVGIRATNGAQVDVTACTLTGTAGDLKSGNLAATNYAGLPQFDITAVGAGGATGTGARIY